MMLSETVKMKRQRLGEMLLESQRITQNQLKEALRVQSQSGERIGSILVERGHIDVEELLTYLGRQLNVPTANLYKLTIELPVLEIIPFKKIKEYRVLPVANNDDGITLAMVNPRDVSAISDLEFLVSRPLQPVVVPHYQMSAVIKHLEEHGERLAEPFNGAQLEMINKQKRLNSDLLDLGRLFRTLVEEEASDLLLTAGVPPCLKKDNEIKRISHSSLTPQQIKAYAEDLLSVQQREEFERQKELDFAYTFPEFGRFRINIYQQRNSISIAARHIVETIPRIEKLGLPPWIEDFAVKTQGLILITGPTGHGKTTTLAAMVDIINTKRKCNILTIEDPIEYLHKHKASNVNQREVGIDTSSFHEGLRHVFRQSPDVIVIGEMRDPESFAIGLQAAETGHLVLSTLHSNTATSTIDRIIDIFPPQKQQQIRVQLAENFLLILNQRLISLKDGGGRILAYEKLANTYRVRNLIREGKTHQIRSMLQQSMDDFISIDQSLARLCIEGKITLENGLKFCDNSPFFNELVNRGTVR
ncbi:MAG: PilT/PilU family type 4a pilus ATPase [Thermodesulfovibrionales bacterium]|jgi:twitching motility protein PilT